MLKRVCRAMRLTGLVAAGVLARDAQGQFQSLGVDLLSHLNLNNFTSPFPSSGNDCWGYRSPSGREYALMGLADRVAFVEITNPASPVIRKEIFHSNSLWGDIKVYQNYCYVSNETGGGVQVINMAGIDTGTVTLVTNVTGAGLWNAHNLAIDETSGFLYVCGATSMGGGGGVAIYSLANPANPTYVNMLSGTYTHDAQVVTHTSGPYAGRQIAYLSQSGSGMWVVDMTNKASLQILAQRTYPGLAYCHQAWLSEDYAYLYVDDELDGPGGGVPYKLTRVFNVTNINAPFLAGTFTGVVSGAIDHNQYVKGNLIYQSNYTSGLHVYDRTNPTDPVEVAWFDTYPENDSPNYDGTWSNYPFFPSGTVIISDMSRGLFVVRVDTDYLVFDFPDGLPGQVEPDQVHVLRVDITDRGTPVNPATVMLFASIDNGPFTGVTMIQEDADTFVGLLPSAPCRSTVRYYVQASNTAGKQFKGPSAAPTATFSVTPGAGAGQVDLFTFDMETDAGWTRSLNDTATNTSYWERGDPEPTAAQPGDDHTPGAGVNCWITGRQAGVSLGSFDVDSGKTTLQSPVMNLSAAPADVRVGYWRWFSNSTGAAANAFQDVFRIETQVGSTSWVLAEAVGPTGPEVSGGWFYHDFRLSDFVPLATNNRFRFIAEDDPSPSLVEAAIDDFQVFYYSCNPTCDRIDYNNDGIFPDIQDLLDFISVFGGGACSNGLCGDIDVNNDGVEPDTADLLKFLDLFAGGPC